MKRRSVLFVGLWKRRATRTPLIAASLAYAGALAACASKADSPPPPSALSDAAAEPPADDAAATVDAGVADASDDVYRALDAGPCMGNFARDMTFGDQGVHYGQDTFIHRPMFITEDDRVVAATGSAIVTRLLQDGTPDPLFGSAGEALVQAGDNQAVDVIANAGGGRTFAIRGASVVRLDASGKLDATFGSGGKATVGAAQTSVAAALVRPTGELVLVGNQFIGGASRFLATQLTASGLVDPNFGHGSPAPPPVANSASATALVLQPDGKLIVGGARDAFPVEGGPPQRTPLFARYLSDGSLDPAFGTGGALLLPPIASSHVARIRMQSSGAIVFIIHGDFGTTGFLIGRLTANGTLDTGFGTGGFTSIDFDGFNDTARDLIVLPDDKVLVGGTALPPGKVPMTSTSLAFVRLDPNGALDPTFGQAGRLLVPIADGPHELESMGFQSTGALVVSSTKLVTMIPWQHEFFRLSCDQ